MFNSILQEFDVRAFDLEPRLGLSDVQVEQIRSFPERQQIRLINQGIGIEIEAEGVGRLNVNAPINAWEIETDNSLRNAGREFKTVLGKRLGHVPQMLHEFEAFGKFVYTERTSVHVHLDARKFTFVEVQALLGLYTVFEDALFEFAGNQRRHNVFCVPLRESNALMIPKRGMRGIIHDWSKYAAINLQTLSSFGTVEFRHMEGNDDSKRIQTWTVLLALLMDYVKMKSFETIKEKVNNLKVNSNYFEFAQEVFGNLANVLQFYPVALDEAVTDAKMWLCTKPTVKAPEMKRSLNQLFGNNPFIGGGGGRVEVEVAAPPAADALERILREHRARNAAERAR